MRSRGAPASSNATASTSAAGQHAPTPNVIPASGRASLLTLGRAPASGDRGGVADREERAVGRSVAVAVEALIASPVHAVAIDATSVGAARSTLGARRRTGDLALAALGVGAVFVELAYGLARVVDRHALEVTTGGKSEPAPLVHDRVRAAHQVTAGPADFRGRRVVGAGSPAAAPRGLVSITEVGTHPPLAREPNAQLPLRTHAILAGNGRSVAGAARRPPDGQAERYSMHVQPGPERERAQSLLAGRRMSTATDRPRVAHQPRVAVGRAIGVAVDPREAPLIHTPSQCATVGRHAVARPAGGQAAAAALFAPTTVFGFVAHGLTRPAEGLRRVVLDGAEAEGAVARNRRDVALTDRAAVPAEGTRGKHATPRAVVAARSHGVIAREQAHAAAVRLTDARAIRAVRVGETGDGRRVAVGTRGRSDERARDRKHVLTRCRSHSGSQTGSVDRSPAHTPSALQLSLTTQGSGEVHPLPTGSGVSAHGLTLG